MALDRHAAVASVGVVSGRGLARRRLFDALDASSAAAFTPRGAGACR